MSDGFLTGVRVLDLSRLVAGNALSLQLADHGADVVKIEPLPDGDPLRAWTDGGYALHWKVYCRNKRSLGLQFRDERSRDLLSRLAAKADVFIEAFKPGTLESMGLGPGALIEANPDLIVARISGFGQTGPYADRPGFGTVVEAMSGFAAKNGFPDREPVVPPIALADMTTGLYGAFAITGALLARVQGRARGQVIDLSLFESVISILGPDAAAYKALGVIKPRTGSGSNLAAPRNVYRTGDGKFIALSGSIQSMAMRVLRLVGGEALAKDPRFASNSERVKNREALDALVGGWMEARTRDEALAVLREEGITAGPVYDAADLIADPHVQGRGVFQDIEDDELGSVAAHAPLPRLSATPAAIRRAAPTLGQDNRAVLADYGFGGDEIAALLTDGVVGPPPA